MTKYEVEIHYTGIYTQEVVATDIKAAKELAMKDFLFADKDFDDITYTDAVVIE